jgi:succinyldiaminopimelate transaminase
VGLADIRDLPYPWDTLADVIAAAKSHPDGMIDLSIGTPVDPTPEVIRRALVAASDAPGYPMTYGTPALRDAVAEWFERRRGVPGLDPSGVLPTVGSKELVGLLPALLRLGPGDVIVHPRVAYPTYDVGARVAGAVPLATDTVADWAGNPAVKLVWVNSPSNPTGAVLSVPELREVVAAARAIGAVVVSDECYAELGWDGSPVQSLLDPAVCHGDATGLLVAYSLSKQSNLAGYRAAFVAGDPALVADLLATRKHLGLIVPWPVQEALRVALGDDEHVDEQVSRYRARREILRGALLDAGWSIDDSEAGLYLWTRPGSAHGELVGRGSRAVAAWFAKRGILVAPGEFYGDDGDHVRIALTASDADIERAAGRLGA